ncbi:cysteine synthase A [Denitrovibrio acetiphilus DSM 12809]|uniref:Cysteine synthase n=1 Tax=Denitrovibrio acetiphilus (strain DSM 12809 / NBRC 114555 / N2460) TaxID=522772 RepID=D4H3M9_DENA2|nr:cysteine synthase A [Denitrovibrio acetiphilus]ADD69131.1 cysteine synthase A [Denitrovibrio acetiphilus DSM 12809]
MKIFENNSLTIGETPLVRLNSIQGKYKNNIFAKVEGRNPAYSVKCRVAAGIIKQGIESGKLKEGMTIIEATSGNTGIGLSYAGAALGFKVAIIMPDTMTMERRMMMQAFGTELILTDGKLGMKGAVALADEMVAKEPEKYFLANQFRNPANPLIHEATTGPEIFRDTDGKVDVFVSGVGTGGTITGVSRYLKNEKGLNILTVAAEPVKSPVISQFIEKQPLQPGPHTIQGIGAGFIPETLDVSLIDDVEQIDDENAKEYARRLAREEGIISGVSSGAAVCAAIQAIEKYKLEGKNIVVILPDSGERYLSSGLFQV